MTRKNRPGQHPTAPLRIAMIGTRGVPAAYGGFETAVEEVGRRLIGRGHRVLVYGRDAASVGDYHLGMRRLTLPSLRHKSLETLSHTGLSVVHAATRAAPDAAFVFNAANAPFLPLLRARGIPSALHMDGLEWRRSKWGHLGRAYYRWAEQFGVQSADALIADAPGIADYYGQQFGVATELIRYGASTVDDAPVDGLNDMGIEPGRFHLVVARFEPENHVLEIVEGYRASNAQLPLIVVGSAPYNAAYTVAVRAAAREDPRIRFLGGIWNQGLLDALYFHAFTYVHGHSVGGTNPSLLRAMGASTAVIAYDVGFNREVLDGEGWFFRDGTEAGQLFTQVETVQADVAHRGTLGRSRALELFRWEAVTDSYAELAHRIAAGYSIHATARAASRARVPHR